MDIYINNSKYQASDDETIIQVADRHDIHIPRFCYHKRLSIVASCNYLNPYYTPFKTCSDVSCIIAFCLRLRRV